jgi:hypothetical protein
MFIRETVDGKPSERHISVTVQEGKVSIAIPQKETGKP